MGYYYYFFNLTTALQHVDRDYTCLYLYTPNKEKSLMHGMCSINIRSINEWIEEVLLFDDECNEHLRKKKNQPLAYIKATTRKTSSLVLHKLVVVVPLEMHSDLLNLFHTVPQEALWLEYEIQLDFELFL